MEVTVLIPAYNEEEHLSVTLQALWSAPKVAEIIVVDDGSRDNTAAVSKEAGARVIRLSKNRGKGGAVTAAFPCLKSDFILLVDADLEESAPEALKLAEPVWGGEADLSIARFPKGLGGQGFGMVKTTASTGIYILTKRLFSAPLSGQRCLKRRVLAQLLPLAARFGMEVGMTIDAVRKGYRVIEVETCLRHCPPGRDWQGFAHRGRQFCDVCLTLGRRTRG